MYTERNDHSDNIPFLSLVQDGAWRRMSGPDTKYRKEAPTAITIIITTIIATIFSIMTTIIDL